MQTFKAGQTCKIFCRASTFRLPKDSSTPVILIGPGTGIAPMRALLQERQCTGATGENYMYFGCKNRTDDYLYRDELEAYEKDKTITSLRLAFSREQKNKVYVQHLLKEDSVLLKKLVLEQNAHIYICGATMMGADVVKVLKEVVGEDLVKKMSGEGKLVQELWA